MAASTILRVKSRGLWDPWPIKRECLTRGSAPIFYLKNSLLVVIYAVQFHGVVDTLAAKSMASSTMLIQNRNILGTAGSNSMTSWTLWSSTPWNHEHCWVQLYYITDTVEFDSMTSWTLLSSSWSMNPNFMKGDIFKIIFISYWARWTNLFSYWPNPPDSTITANGIKLLLLDLHAVKCLWIRKFLTSHPGSQ